MKTDSIFYSLFQSFPGIFFELLNCPPSEANFYEFTSREVKQLAFRLDGLFLPNSNDLGKPFYVVEVQFQPDDNLYYRLFGELFLFLRQYQPPHPWQVVVIYPSRSVERQQTLQFRELLSRVTSIYLDELGSVSESSFLSSDNEEDGNLISSSSISICSSFFTKTTKNILCPVSLITSMLYFSYHSGLIFLTEQL